MRFSQYLLPTWLCVATALGAPIASEDDDCEIVWVLSPSDVPSSSTTEVSLPSTTEAAISTSTTTKAAVSTPKASPADGESEKTSVPADVGSSSDDDSKPSSPAPATSSADTGSLPGALPAGSYPNGITVVDTKAWPGHFLAGKTLQAPQCEKEVPAGAAIYTPPTPGVLDLGHFEQWRNQQLDRKLASKYMKVAPGWYEYKVTNGVTTIAIGQTFVDGWTLDLRGVTFVYDVTVTKDAGMYINQALNLYVCGGTFWNDVIDGEIFTQAKVTDAKQVDGDTWEYTAKVDAGYDVAKWRSADARNVDVMDVSDATHFKHPEVNLWYATFPFDVSDDGTIKFKMGKSRGQMQKGYMLSMQMTGGSAYCVSNEFTGGLTLDGLTCNG